MTTVCYARDLSPEGGGSEPCLQPARWECRVTGWVKWFPYCTRHRNRLQAVARVQGLRFQQKALPQDA